MIPMGKNDDERRTMLNSIGPIWDGNEVWLVIAGGVLFARVPARLRLAVLRLLPRVHARAVRDDPAHGRDGVPEQGAVAALAVVLGHGVRARLDRAGVPARRRVRQRPVRACRWTRTATCRSRSIGLLKPFAAAGRRDDRRDVRDAWQPVPGPEDRGRPPGPDPAGGAAADRGLLRAQHGRRGRDAALPGPDHDQLRRRHLAGHLPGGGPGGHPDGLPVRAPGARVRRVPRVGRDDRAARHLGRRGHVPEPASSRPPTPPTT